MITYSEKVKKLLLTYRPADLAVKTGSSVTSLWRWAHRGGTIQNELVRQEIDRLWRELL